MPRLFQTLQLLDERAQPGPAPWNMAMDEALLMESPRPVLRFYCWERPAFSFGYFLPWAEAREVSGGRECVRRWTGGGMVEHGTDVTWSLIIPVSEPAAGMRPVESYSIIHGALAAALQSLGVDVHQVTPDCPAPAGGLCFTAPAPGDLMVGGRKIAGAGQRRLGGRRARRGQRLLHQGSISGVALPGAFPEALASSLAEEVTPFSPDLIPRGVAAQLVATRYGQREWLEKR